MRLVAAVNQLRKSRACYITRISRLEAGTAEDANGGSGPGDMGVEVIEPCPSLIEANEPWDEHNFASITQNYRLSFRLILTLIIRAWVRRFTTHRHRHLQPNSSANKQPYLLIPQLKSTLLLHCSISSNT